MNKNYFIFGILLILSIGMASAKVWCSETNVPCVVDGCTDISLFGMWTTYQWSTQTIGVGGEYFPIGGMDFSGYDTSCIVSMYNAFAGTDFNGNISSWDTSNTSDFSYMFYGDVSFDQDISGWNISLVTDMTEMFGNGAGLSQENYDKLLIGWASQTVQPNVTFNAGNVEPLSQEAIDAKDVLISNGWIITDTSSCSICSELCSPCGGGCTATNLTGMYLSVSNFDATYGNISGWNTSCIVDMSSMFYYSDFNQDISSWDTSSVVNMAQMFHRANFNQDISSWNVSQVTNMEQMLSSTPFNYPLNNWDTSKVTNMNMMFYGNNVFNQDISDWDVSQVTNMGLMFASGTYPQEWEGNLGPTIFNQNLSKWNFTNVENFNSMFSNHQGLKITYYDELLNAIHNTNNKTGLTLDMKTTQKYSDAASVAHDNLTLAEYSGGRGWTINDGGLAVYGGPCDVCTELCSPCGGGCTATDLTSMFFAYDWVTDISEIGDISGWNTSCVTSMSSTFANSGFNQDIGDWDTSSTITMDLMFNGASSFNQNLSAWNVSQVTTMDLMFDGSALSISNYDELLNGWSSRPVQPNVPFSVGTLTYSSNSLSAHDILTNDPNYWIITDGGLGYLPGECGICNETCSPCGGGCVGTNLSNMYLGAIDFDVTYGNISGWNTSCINDMSFMFTGATDFNQNINGWDVSNVVDMQYMFDGTLIFNQPLNNWNTSKVTNMEGMFGYWWSSIYPIFDQDISSWDTSSVTKMGAMFVGSQFNQPIGIWNTSNVVDMNYMFGDAAIFNQNISGWDTSKVTNMEGMFLQNPNFNQPIGIWDTSKVTLMDYMFYQTTFNQDISGWDTSSVTDMQLMFTENLYFNQPIGSWDTSKVTIMNGMFGGTNFNQDISSWNISQVTDMSNMFYITDAGLSQENYDLLLNSWASQNVQSSVDFNAGGSVFSQSASASRNKLKSINLWGINDGGANYTCSVCDETCSPCSGGCDATTLTGMYQGVTGFDITYGNISNWDTSCITDMSDAFKDSDFNQDISRWNVGNVLNMSGMFSNTTFDQNIGAWVVVNLIDATNMFDAGNLSIVNYDALLNGWVAKGTNGNVVFSAGNSMYSAYGKVSHDYLTDTQLWTITDAGMSGEYCTVCTETCSPCGGGCTATSLSYMYNAYDWVTDANGYGDITGWNTSCITNLDSTFGESNFNQDISGWDTSNVTSMISTFYQATSFNQPIGSWNTSKVTNMDSMFIGTAFNQPLNWDVSQVTNMEGMFGEATSFNQDISGWNVSNVNFMGSMFYLATSFEQDLGDWKLDNIGDMTDMFTGVNLSTNNYDSILNGWSASVLQVNIPFGAGDSQYSINALSSRNNLINNYGWTITDGGFFVNSAPVINSWLPIDATPQITDRQIQAFSINATDVDMDNLNYEWYIDGVSQSYNSNSYIVNGTTLGIGVFNITALVSDGQLMSTYEWTLYVNSGAETTPPYLVSTNIHYNYVNGSFIMNIICADDNSGMNRIDYSVYNEMGSTWLFDSTVVGDNLSEPISNYASISENGGYYLWYSCVDNDGNTYNTTTELFYFDASNPALNEVNFADGATFTSEPYLTVSGYDTGSYQSGIGYITVDVYDVTDSILFSTSNTGTADTLGLPEGFYKLRYNIVDAVGNNLASLTSLSFSYDVGGPSLSYIYPALNDNVPEDFTAVINITEGNPKSIYMIIRDNTFTTYAETTCYDVINCEIPLTDVPYGTYTFDYILEDYLGNTAGGTSDVFYVINTAPTINSYSPLNLTPTISYLQTQNFSIVASDFDEDVLSYDWFVNGISQSINETTFIANGTTLGIGNYVVSVNVSDGNQVTSQSWDLTVRDKAPTINTFYPSNLNPQMFINQSQHFNITSSDFENDTLIYEWYINNTAQSNNYTYFNVNGSIGKGLYNIRVDVTDGTNVVNKTWNLNVKNLPPVINVTFPEIETNISTKDNQTFNVSASSLDNLTYAWYLNGLLQPGFVPEFDIPAETLPVGTYNITVQITDTNNNTIDYTWTLDITNRAPVITVITPTDMTPTMSIKQVQIFNTSVTDYENNSLIYDWFVNGTSQNRNLTHFSVNGSEFGVGSYNIQMYANDTFNNNSASKTWILTIVDNQLPTMNGYSPASSTPGIWTINTQAFSVSVTDGDNEPLTYEWYIDGVAQSRNLPTFTALGYDLGVGIFNITSIITDGYAMISREWALNVTTRPNQPPVMSGYTPTDLTPHLYQNGTGPFGVSVTDIDMDEIHYIWYVNEVNQLNDFDSFSFTNSSELGYYNITAIAYDILNQSVRQDWLLEVIPVPNFPPQIDSYSPLDTTPIITTLQLQNFSIVVSDIENDVLSYDWFVNGSSQSRNSTTFTMNGSEWITGTYLITALVTQFNNTNDTQSWTLSIVEPGPIIESVDLQPVDISPQNQMIGSCLASSEGNLIIDYEFYKNGAIYQNDSVLVISGEELSVNLGATLTPGDVWYFRCMATDNQSRSSTWEQSSNRTVLFNILPVIDVRLNNNMPFYDGNSSLGVSCSATDANGDTIESYELRVFREGVLYNQNMSSSYTTPNLIFVTGEQWSASCRVSDGYNTTDWANSSITVQRNARPPTISDVRIYPIIMYANSSLYAITSAYDINGDDLIYYYTLYDNSVAVETQNVTESRVNFTYSNLSAGRDMSVGVVVSDIDYTLPQRNSSVVVVRASNHAPYIQTVRMSPNSFVRDNEDIDGYCNAIDLDGDGLSYNYMWYRNNTLIKMGSKSQGYLGYSSGSEVLVDTLSNVQTVEGLPITFSCQPSDTADLGDYVNTSDIMIYTGYSGNFIPQIGSVTITPGAGDKFQVFNVSATITDKNPNSSVRVEWRIYKNNGAGTTQITQYYNTTPDNYTTISLGNIPSEYGTSEDEFYVKAMAFDGTDYSGAWIESNTVTISNSPPIMVAASIINIPYDNVSLVSECSATDLDSTTITFEKKWFVNGVSPIIFESLQTIYTKANDTVMVACRASDGISVSDWFNSDNVTIIGTVTPPTISSISLTGDGSKLYGSCGVYDVKGDNVTFNVSFYKNGVLQNTQTRSNIIPDAASTIASQTFNYTTTFTAGDQWTFTCRGSTEDGYSNSTASFLIPAISFSYSTSTEIQKITVDWSTNADYVKVWLGNNYLGNTTLSRYIFESLNPDTKYQITLQPVKSGLTGPLYAFNVTTEPTDNNRPVMINSTITPIPAYTDSTLFGYCNSTDIESPSIFYTYNWYVNNVVVDTGVSVLKPRNTLVSVRALLSTYIQFNDTVRFGCVANDGISSSDEMLSDNLTISNTPQIISSVFVTANGSNYDCNHVFSDIDGDNQTSVRYVWYRNGIDVGVNTSSISGIGIIAPETLRCGVNSSTIYHSIIQNSTLFTIGDFELPTISNIAVPTTVYTDTPVEIKLDCADNVVVASGYPKITFINPNLLEGEYPIFADTGDSFSRYLTFPTAGQYTDIEFSCMDGNGNNKIVKYDGSIFARVRENIVDDGGSNPGGDADEEVLVFTINPQKQTFNLNPGRTRIVEFEVINEMGSDTSFTAAILVDGDNPEVYNWMSFEGGIKATTFDIKSRGSLSAGGKYLRYYITIPENTPLGKYKGEIEVVAGTQESKYTVTINVVSGTTNPLLAFLGFDLFQIPFTSSPITGGVVGVGDEIGKPFKVWMLLLLISAIIGLILWFRRK